MKGVKLPVPADFADRAAEMTAKALGRHYAVAWCVVSRWARLTGIEPIKSTVRPVPSDFAAQARRMTQSQLMRHYAVCHRVVQRWSRVTGHAPIRGRQLERKPIPEDFRERAAVTTQIELSRHYGAHSQTVKRWCRLTRIEPPRYVRPRKEKAPRIAKPKTSRPAAFRTPKQAHSFDTLRRETTTDGLAADHLRRFCAVYRCNERGRADQDGAWWRYGNAILTPAELIERAERHGFDAQGWRRLAA